MEQYSLEQLGEHARAHYNAAEKSAGKVRQHTQSAGLYLIEAKRRVALRKDITWPQFLKAHCDIGRARADEIIRIAEGRTTVEEVKGRQKERDTRRRASARDAKAAVVHSESAQITEQIQPKAPTDPDRAPVMERILAKLAALSVTQLETIERLIPDVRRPH